MIPATDRSIMPPMMSKVIPAAEKPAKDDCSATSCKLENCRKLGTRIAITISASTVKIWSAYRTAKSLKGNKRPGGVPEGLTVGPSVLSRSVEKIIVHLPLSSPSEYGHGLYPGPERAKGAGRGRDTGSTTGCCGGSGPN